LGSTPVEAANATPPAETAATAITAALRVSSFATTADFIMRFSQIGGQVCARDRQERRDGGAPRRRARPERLRWCRGQTLGETVGVAPRDRVTVEQVLGDLGGQRVRCVRVHL
jgi:hypothetical protein